MRLDDVFGIFANRTPPTLPASWYPQKTQKALKTELLARYLSALDTHKITDFQKVVNKSSKTNLGYHYQE